MKKIVCVIFTLLFCVSFGQKKATDLKEDKLNEMPDDSAKVQALLKAATESIDNMIKMQAYAVKGLELARLISYKRGEALAYEVLGTYHEKKGDYPLAMNYFTQALKIAEETKDTFKLVSSGINIGNIYFSQNAIKDARKRYQEALDLAEKIKFKQGIANCCHNIAGCYYMEKNIDKCFEFLKKHIQISTEMGKTREVAHALGNLGSLYASLNRNEEAMKYIDSSIALKVKVRDVQGIASSLNLKGEIYTNIGKYREALTFYKAALDTAAKVESKETINDAYQNIAVTFAAMKDFENAYKYQVMNFNLKDSLFNDNFSKQITEMQAKYDTEVKDKELVRMESEKKILEADSKRKSMQRNAFIAGFGIMILLAIFILRSYRQKQKANKLIEHQKQLVEEKQKEIIDSINYAKRIQSAILAKEEDIKKYFQESFLLYKPKDIVAGDFYFFETTDTHVLYAAADCTGHGVPGALVSVVCSNALTRCVKEFRLSDPGQILNKTRELVLETFMKSGQEVKDGMDISLVSLQKNGSRSNPDSLKIKWAGANNPLWYISKGNAYEVAADKQPIGASENQLPFTSHTVELFNGDIFYLFTDGYADQFGGPKGKKLKYKQFNSFLSETCQMPLSEQKMILDSKFEEWKGKLEQVDDVCVIGVRV